MNTFSSVRHSPIAGTWYPSDPNVLRNEIGSYIDQAAPPPLPGKVMGLIVPHAGYFYSGKTAGYAYRCVMGEAFDTCAIFSPLHDYMPHDLLTSAHQAYATPLGQVPVDTYLVDECSAKIEESTGVLLQHIANDHEHSLEIQLPFLQYALSSPFTLLPVMVRTEDPKLLKSAARCIATALEGRKVLCVGSTDLSHFYSEEEAKEYDDIMLDRMHAFSPDEMLEAERYRMGFACGVGAVSMMLWVTRFLGATHVTLLDQSTSAAASGDTSRVVGYGALAVTREG